MQIHLRGYETNIYVDIPLRYSMSHVFGFCVTHRGDHFMAFVAVNPGVRHRNFDDFSFEDTSSNSAHFAILVYLRDLSWKVHPPTSQSFFRHFFELPSLERIAADPAAKQELTDLSHFLIELSVCDYFFVTRSPSSIAIASICNALDEISASSSPLGKAELLVIQKEFSTEVVKYASDALHTDGGEVAKCRQRLRYMYQNAVCRQNELEDESHLDERLENMSPSCVSDENVDWQPSHKSVEHPRKTSKTETRTSPGGASQKKNYSS